MTGAAPAPVVTIRSIAAGGDGVARLDDGRTVFVPRTAPGDEIELGDVQLRARFARATIAALRHAGPGRVPAPCPHYDGDQCGGCQLMHLNPAAQRAAKARIAGDALRRIARRERADPPVTASPVEFGYRNKVTFAVRQGRIGYHRLHQADAIFDVRECLIAEPRIRALHAALRAARPLLPSSAVRVTLRVDREGRSHLIVGTTPDGAWTGAEDLDRALRRSGVDAVIWWHPEGGAPRAMAGAADPWPATVFEQVHPAMGRLVRSAALDALGEVRGRMVWDLYAGIGESTAEIARRGASVESVERDRAAVAVAERMGPDGPIRHAAAVEDAVGRLPRADSVLTNPPRTGMTADVVEAIAHGGASRVVYVSCDPATLARDIARLGDGFELTSVAVFDQFPQTAHMESVAVLERR